MSKKQCLELKRQQKRASDIQANKKTFLTGDLRDEITDILALSAHALTEAHGKTSGGGGVANQRNIREKAKILLARSMNFCCASGENLYRYVASAALKSRNISNTRHMGDNEELFVCSKNEAFNIYGVINGVYMNIIA